MNYKLPTLSFLGLTILSLTAIYQLPVLAERTAFYCDETKSPPMTYIKSRGRKSAVIRWSLGVSRNSALQRCRIVSQRFQRQLDSGNLRFFKLGNLNGYNVVCAARTSGDRCDRTKLLFTLTKGSDPNTLLAKLFNLNSLANNAVINQSGRSELPSSPARGGEDNAIAPEPQVENDQAYSFEGYINDLPNEEDKP